MHSSAASDAQQQDTYFIVAHIHYVLFGGSIFALLAGVHYWFPKITGRLLNEPMAKLNFWVTFIGFNLAFFPMHFLGLDGMPRRIYTYDADMGWNLWNAVSSAGAATIAFGMLIFLYNAVQSYMKGEIAGSDPWDGRTLEWSISSPPPEYNFEQIPTVHGRDPFWDQKRRRISTVPVAGGSDDTEHSIHLPQPSYWPIVVSIGLLIGGYGLIYIGSSGGLSINLPDSWSWPAETDNALRISWGVIAAAIGGAIALVSTYAWSFEPVNDPDEASGH